jgi:hypothetical protein
VHRSHFKDIGTERTLCWIKHVRDQGSRLSDRQKEETSSRTGVTFAANPFVDIPLSFDVTQDIPIEVLHTVLLVS